MERPKVSVIIPVYNTAPYLKESVGSIMKQTLQDLQIIIVNDGSTDNSAVILEDLAAKDNRIQIISQHNMGLSGARNAGLPFVKGQYIYFMDSDDYLSSDCLEVCYDRCEKQNLDFVIFDAENVYENNVSHNMQEYSRKGLLDDTEVYRGCDFLKQQLDKFAFRASACLIFARFSFVSKYFNGFYQGIIHEDHLYTVPLHLYAENVGYIPECFFKRRVRQNSIMTRNFSMKNIRGYMVTTEELLKLAIPNKCFSIIIQQYLNQMLNAVVWESHKLKFIEKFRFLFYLTRKGYLKFISSRNIMVMLFKNNG